MPQRPQKTKPSTPKLSDAARHLVLPKGIVSTGFPAVRETCLKLKIVFDPWQEGAGSAILGKRADGLYAADAVVVSIPRQVGKTYLIGAIVIALCIVQPKTLAIWTAHHGSTAADTFRDLKEIVQRPELKPHVRSVYDSGARLEIVFTNGSRILFGAREHGFGRGFKRVGILVFDEAQILTPRAADDMIPTTNRHPNPLILYMGTPPKPSDPSEHFTRMRQEALAGESDDVLYVEMSADTDADPKDREQWAKANPSYPHHTTARAMLRMLKNLGLASFLREGLGIWDGTATAGAFSSGAWARCSSKTRPGDPAGMGIAADLEQTWLSLGAAGVGERRHLGPRLRLRFDTERAQFVRQVAEIAAEWKDVPVVIDRKGPAAPLIEELEDAGVNLTLIGLDELVQASADMRDAVETKRVAHANYPILNDAVDSAAWRKIGDRRAFGRRTGDISMLEAVTLALYGATDLDYDVLDSIF